MNERPLKREHFFLSPINFYWDICPFSRGVTTTVLASVPGPSLLFLIPHPFALHCAAASHSLTHRFACAWPWHHGDLRCFLDLLKVVGKKRSETFVLPK